MKDTAFLIGRLVFGGFFLYNGINHFKNRQMLTGYTASKNVPNAEAAVMASGALLVAGGASLMLGVKPKYGAAAVLAFLAGATPIMHNFWATEDPGQRMGDQINFFKNVAMAGAAVALGSVDEPWPMSVPVAQPTTSMKVRKFVRKAKKALAA